MTKRLFIVLCAPLVLACGSTQQLVDQQQKALTSLKATVTAVCTAWLDGNVSTIYARTALETTAALLEKERATIGATPDALADPAVASLSESQNQLARELSLLRKAVGDSDTTTVRQLIMAAGSRRPQVP